MASTNQILTKQQTLALIDHAQHAAGESGDLAELACYAVREDDQEGLLQALDRPSVPGRWVGSALRLDGPATVDRIKTLLIDGQNPDDPNEALRTSAARNTAYAQIYAAPKSVSLLLAHPDDRVRHAVEMAHQQAVDAAIQTLERTARVRSGHAGTISESVTGLTGAAWTHHTASAGDPHLHTHVILAASAPRARDGAWRALDGKIMLGAQRLAAATYSLTLRNTLTEQLGVRWEAKPVGSTIAWEIAGLKEPAEKASNTRKRLESIVQSLGKVLDQATWKEQLTAWRIHRRDRGALSERLEHDLDRVLASERADVLRDHWRQQYGLTFDHDQLKRDSNPRVLHITADQYRALADADQFEQFEHNIRKELDKQHHWSIWDLAAQLHSRGVATPEDALTTARDVLHRWHETGRLAGNPKDFHLIDDLITQQPTKTDEMHQQLGFLPTLVLKDTLAHEQQLTAQAADLASQTRLRLNPIPPEGFRYTPEQENAVRMLSEGRALSAIVGVAGAGKTTILKPLAKAAQQSGLQVISISRNALRAIETREDIGADRSMSIAQFFREYQNGKLNLDHTLIVHDEAALTHQDQWKQLLDLLSVHRSAQMIALGDRLQMQAIDRRATWALITQGTSEANALASLNTSYRTKAWETEASLLRSADPHALEIAQRDGRIRLTTEENKIDDAARLIEQYRKQGEDAVGFARTNTEAAELASRIQALRFGPEHETPIETRHDGQFAGIGDDIRIRQNDSKREIYNGQLWTIHSITDNGDIVLQHGNKKTLITPDFARDGIELAYTRTVDSSQGMTCDRAILLADDMDYSAMHTGATRGRNAPVWLTAKPPDHLKENLQNYTVSETAQEILDRDKNSTPEH